MATESSSPPARVSTSIAPWLTVPDGPSALEFYKAAFGAIERYRLEDERGRVVVAQLLIDQADFWFSEDSDATSASGPVRMLLTVDDPRSVFSQALAAGATEIAPIDESFGWLVGRLADPFGHHWEVGKPLEGASSS
jgi:PhnB protein